ncbi:MAG: glucan 1,4-alpha-glucosidase [Lysobacterales bacterium]
MPPEPSPATGEAPGRPGSEPRWTSSAKCGVGTAPGAGGRVWFTLSHGILNEVYYPRLDQACIRDLGLIVTNRSYFFSEEKRHARHEVATTDGVPAFHLTNTCAQGYYRIEKDVVADPAREVVLQRVRFTALKGTLADYSLYALLAPHLGNAGAGNTAWVGEVRGLRMLFAERDGTALALACSAGWSQASAGFVGVSDGWRDLMRHGRMTWFHERASDGNVALTGEIDLAGSEGCFVLALGLGRSFREAAHRAAASLWDGFEAAERRYRDSWKKWQSTLPVPGAAGDAPDIYRTSMAVLRSHQSSRFPGGMIASLSIPWGFSKGDGDLGGYHLAWPRDLVESAGGLLAAGAVDDVRRVLRFLAVTQNEDGSWPQNMWLDGTPYWTGVQMDEAGLPILLVDLARREGCLPDADLARLWPMIRRAVAFIACNGPVTQQDRWEEDPGYSPFTLAVEIAALLCAADFAQSFEPELTAYLQETADAWNASIERWTFASDTDLAREHGVDGYYVRIAPPESAEAASPAEGFVPIKNRPPGQSQAAASHIISPDALALVRFGLRSADDPRILDTVKVIDALLKVDLPPGPGWRRYNGDGYGEHDDGEPFDGTGTGRAWPLLTGERAHYELAAGRKDHAERLLAVMARFANEGGLLPEQVWDGDDLPEKELLRGQPSGSAMPLAWAHAEYVKLRRSLSDGKVFDTPPQTVQRYVVDGVESRLATWRFNHKCQGIPVGQCLRIELRKKAVVHWSIDGWAQVRDLPTRDTGLGIHLADLPCRELAAGVRIDFTFYWSDEDRWEGRDYSVAVLANLNRQGEKPE